MRKLLPNLIIAAALVGAAAPALAGEVTIRVSADGLDLNRASDIVTMKKRIDTAVQKACSKANISFVGTSSVSDCVTDGTAKALAELDARLAQS